MITNRREFLKAGCVALGVGFVVPSLARPVKTPANWNGIPPDWDGPVSTSAIRCPVCGTVHPLAIPSEHSLRVFLCSVCLTWLAPKKGDHCLFDSYGTVPCVITQIKQLRAKGKPVWLFSDLRPGVINPATGVLNP